MQLVASPLWLLWLLVQAPAQDPADAGTSAPSSEPEAQPEGPALPAGALPAGALPEGAMPPAVPGVTGIEGTKSTD